MQSRGSDWFKELYSEVPPEFPPTMRLKTGEVCHFTFQEERPRVVIGGYGKKTAVVNVLYKGEPRSLFVGSNVDLARQIWNIWRRHNYSLQGVSVKIAKLEKKGRNWKYKVEEDSSFP
jgi:hypothetical protein